MSVMHGVFTGTDGLYNSLLHGALNDVDVMPPSVIGVCSASAFLSIDYDNKAYK